MQFWIDKIVTFNTKIDSTPLNTSIAIKLNNINILYIYSFILKFKVKKIKIPSRYRQQPQKSSKFVDPIYYAYCKVS